MIYLIVLVGEGYGLLKERLIRFGMFILRGGEIFFLGGVFICSGGGNVVVGVVFFIRDWNVILIVVFGNRKVYLK